MEFAEEGGEAPTPYEVLLLDAMRGDSTRFTRQDCDRRDLAHLRAAARRAPARAPLRAGDVGPRRPAMRWSPGSERGTARGSRHEPRQEGQGREPPRAPPRRRTRARKAPATPGQGPRSPPLRRAPRRPRRSRRSPTTRSSPTATPARWSRPTGRSTGCASRASTRRACSARCSTARRAPSASRRSGSTCPRRASYEPGTNTLLTTWTTPTGWVIVRDALTLGPRRGVDLVTPHTRPPTDEDADHVLVRVAMCLEGEVEMELTCEPVFDYGRVPAQWTVAEDGHQADASGAETTIRLQTDMAVGVEGDWVSARHTLKQGEQVYCALSWAEELAAPQNVDEANAAPRRDRGASGAAGSPRAPARPSLARADPALGAGDQGAHLHAHRRDGGGAHDLAAGDAGRRAQLGLPLHVAARLDVHAAGAALPQPRLGGRGVHAVHRRSRAQRGRGAADHVRDRRPPRPDRVHARRALRLRGREPGADRQRRLRPAPERRLRRRAGLDPAAHPAQRTAAPAAVADRGGAGRSARPPCGASPTRASGRRAASPSTTSPRS